MVAQIGLVSSDIRAHIEKIEAFSLLRLEDDGSMAVAMASSKRDSFVRYLVPRPSAILSEEEAEMAATTLTTALAPSATLTVISDNAATPIESTVNRHKSDAGVNVTFAEDRSLPIREYFLLIDQQRRVKVQKIKEIFESIGPILIKLESLILGTSTGESPKMALCYASWEKELFKLLIR